MALLRRASAAFAVVAFAVAYDAKASVSIAVPLDTLVATSTAAAFVTPVTQTSVWEGGRIFTYTNVHIDTTVAGEPLPDTIVVRTMGGHVETIGQAVEGEAVLTVGRPSLLFMHPGGAVPGDFGATVSSHAEAYVVTARAQGQFAVVLDALGELRVRRSSGLGAIVAPKSRVGATEAVLAGDALHGARVEDARDSVVKAWGRVHAR